MTICVKVKKNGLGNSGYNEAVHSWINQAQAKAMVVALMLKGTSLGFALKIIICNRIRIMDIGFIVKKSVEPVCVNICILNCLLGLKLKS